MSLDIACQDIICALSSARGQAALAIVRASGPGALGVLQAIFRKHKGAMSNARAMHGLIVDHEQRPIDDVMAVQFARGQSFTKEESFEIHCHGNPLIVDQILRTICSYGARLAEPGEFSMRALLHGAIDLTQAESIADLIHAKSEAAKDAALKGVQGGLFMRCAPMREIIIAVLAEIEARMDFPDEELGDAHRSELLQRLDEAVQSLNALLEHAASALRLHQGIRLVICGAPNAGKSTLLNRLLGHERAIVHDSAGTTRDVIEASMEIDGLPLTLVDVAGIRSANESSAIEQIGIERALVELKRADLVIWLADCTRAEPFGDALIKERLEHLSAPVLKVLNKCELLAQPYRHDEAIFIAAQTGLGLGELKTLISQKLGVVAHEEIFITRARQRDELILARLSLLEARQALSDGLVDEVVCSELRAAGLAFDRLFGTNLPEEVLDRIFSQFCIGK